ncbi:MAG: putative zinc-binding protein [Methanomicrobiaceae archaeon]|nr:putative zinc-binding protein [Methanomicrobiaceae archaeon]
MAEQPSCSCGDTSAQTGTKRIIFPCAGQANTGQLSNLAAIRLTEEGYGSIACMALLATGAEGLKEKIREADEVIIIDGCPVACGQTIAAAQGVIHHQHIVVTALGIAKAGSLEFSDDDLETVVSAAWEGTGRRG